MTTAQQNKIIDFFTKGMDEKTVALFLRRFKEETVRFVLKDKEETYNKEWISEGHYWLTELCEILDPQLEKDC